MNKYLITLLGVMDENMFHQIKEIRKISNKLESLLAAVAVTVIVVVTGVADRFVGFVQHKPQLYLQFLCIC